MAFRGPTDPPITRNHHGIKRERSLGTRLTESEYQLALSAANGTPPSEWVRAVVLERLGGHTDHVHMATLAEVWATQALLLVLIGMLARGEPITDTVLQAEKTAIDAEKLAEARHLLARAGAAR